MAGTRIISVKIGTNLNRTTISATSDKTIRQLLEQEGINYATTTIFLDGDTLHAGDMDKTLDDFNIASECFIIASQKTENA
jgi:beta-lactamase superfamily II metal-dependent hydrolase